MTASTVQGPAIWGVGTSTFGRSDQRIEQLAWTAVVEAISDAQITPDQVDAVFLGSVFGAPGVAARIQRGLGLGGLPVVRVEAACASGTVALHEASIAVESGRYATVLVIGVEQLSALGGGALPAQPTDVEASAGLPLPGIYALAASRYMHTFGATPEMLAQVAVKNKANGALNERAHLRSLPPTLEEVMASAMIAEPLTRLQCCPVTDGAGAAVVGARRTSRDIGIAASALTSGSAWGPHRDDPWSWSPIRAASSAAYALAGVSPTDIDVLEVHDAFTIGEVMTLEALGVCSPGEGALLAIDGHTALKGKQPVNPSGGLLSRGHPLGATGTAQLAEIVWQLRGDAKQRQTATPRLGLVETMGAGAAAMDGNACVVMILDGT